ncbi:MAG: carboxypeptidase regulatory-like domain-containing protein [Planctomycetes bacterium]|nr:carboxypeptidase regulatory-like domain-containing protein [Planctomycetota bacterium]
MKRSRALSVALGIAIAAALWIARRTPEPPVPTTALPSSPATTDGAVRPIEASRRSPVDGPSVNTGLGHLSILTVAEESGQPIGGATLQPMPRSDEPFSTSRSDPFTETDATGRADIDLTEVDTPFLLVRATHRVASVIDLAVARRGESPVVVSMQAAGSVRAIVLRDTGIPIAEALVLLSPAGRGQPENAPARADGNPLSDAPLWSRTTDSFGAADFQGLPDGRYALNALHADYLPYSDADVDRIVDVAGVTDVHVTMTDLYGVVFACPTRADVERVAWDLAVRDVDIRAPVVRRLGYGRRALERRFPDGLVLVHRPWNPDVDVLVRCQAVTEDDAIWVGEWPLVPVRCLTDPVFMRQDTDHAYRDMLVRVRTVSGRPLSMPIRLFHEDTRMPIDCPPSERRLLPLGTYRVATLRATPQLREALDSMRVVLTATDPPGDVLDIVLDTELLPLTIRPLVPALAAASYVAFRIRMADGRTIMMANWTVSEGDLELMVPRGPVRVEARCPGYEDVAAEIDADERRDVLDLPFRARPPAR